MNVLSRIDIASCFVSSACWLRENVINISPEKEVVRRKLKAKRKGGTPNLSGAYLVD